MEIEDDGKSEKPWVSKIPPYLQMTPARPFDNQKASISLPSVRDNMVSAIEAKY